jgi:hypothetical protein
MARTPHLGLCPKYQPPLNASSFSASELWLLYDYAMKKSPRTTTPFADDRSLAHIRSWLVRGAAVAPAVSHGLCRRPGGI